MSPELLSFLRAYAKWAYENGAPESPIFDNSYGLCSNFDAYVNENFPGLAYSAGSELSKMFLAEGLDPSCPFGGMDAYDQDATMATQHSNPLRRAWVLRKLSEHDNDGI